MNGRALGWMAGLVAALGVAQPAWADCTKDIECKGDRVCEAGKCVNPTSATSTASEREAKPPPSPPGEVGPPPSNPPPGSEPAETAQPNPGGPEGGPPPPPPPYEAYPGYPPPYAIRPYPPPPEPPAKMEHRLAARAGLSLSSQTFQDLYGNWTTGLGFGVAGGVGLYLGAQWGVMLAANWTPLIPRAVVADAEIFGTNRWLWGSIGLGYGNFETGSGPEREGGFAWTGNLYFKFLPHWGVGFLLTNVTRADRQGVDSSFSLQLGAAWLY